MFIVYHKSLTNFHTTTGLNGTHHPLVYADGVNILGGSVNTIKKNAKALVVASKENGLEVNADKTKYMVMSRDQNARRKSQNKD